jgi:hypothetical protein
MSIPMRVSAEALIIIMLGINGMEFRGAELGSGNPVVSILRASASTKLPDELRGALW